MQPQSQKHTFFLGRQARRRRKPRRNLPSPKRIFHLGLLSKTSPGTTSIDSRKRGSAEQKLEVNVTACSNLGNVIAGAPKGLFTTNLTPELLVAFIRTRNVRLLNERPATTTANLAVNAFKTEEPKSAAGNLVRFQCFPGLQLLL